MRPRAQIDEIPLAIEADLLVGWDLADIFGLVALADALEERDGAVAVPDLAGDRLVAAHDLAHPLFDPGEIVGRERRLAREIVVKAGLGRRTERDLRFGVQLLDRLGHYMRRVVAQDLDPLRRLARDDRDLRRHGRCAVARSRALSVDLDRNRRLGETGADRGRDIGAGHRSREFAASAVGQRHDNWVAGAARL